jgi:hypothetical protein
MADEAILALICPRLGRLRLPPNPPPLLHGTAEEAAAAPVSAIFLHCSCVCFSIGAVSSFCGVLVA